MGKKFKTIDELMAVMKDDSQREKLGTVTIQLTGFSVIDEGETEPYPVSLGGQVSADCSEREIFAALALLLTTVNKVINDRVDTVGSTELMGVNAIIRLLRGSLEEQLSQIAVNALVEGEADA